MPKRVYAPPVPGSRFGRLVSVEIQDRSKRGEARWLCRCDCGNECAVLHGNLVNGHTSSCGCLMRERATTANIRHGDCCRGNIAPEHQAWDGMIKRCHNPNCKSYSDYGARGITVCQRWRNSYEDFLNDAGRRPSSLHSLDRIDNSLGYQPGNVRWALRLTQNRNTRANHFIEFNNQRKTASEWALQTGIKSGSILFRLSHGWSVERALTEPAIVGKNGSFGQGPAA